MKFAVHFDGWIVVEAENRGLAEDATVDILSNVMDPRFDGICGDWTVLDNTEGDEEVQEYPVFTENGG